MDLKKLKHIHFVGIKGVGMTALALCARDLGIKVSGSDTEEIFVTDEVLKKQGIKWRIGFKKENIVGKPDLVVTTAAHGGLANPEVHAEALGMFMKSKVGISTCGVGGKTTTAAMITTVLEQARLAPSFAIGVGNIFSLNTPARYTEGKYFVIALVFSFRTPRLL